MSEELCDGVKMLIERMQTNPEDFDYTGRLYEHHNMINELSEVPKGHQRLWFLSDVEKKALVDAYKEMHKVKFTAGVVQSILSPPDYDINMDRPYSSSAMRLDSSGNLGIGTQKPSKILAPASLVKQAREILNQEFEKEYAKNSNPRS